LIWSSDDDELNEQSIEKNNNMIEEYGKLKQENVIEVLKMFYRKTHSTDENTS